MSADKQNFFKRLWTRFCNERSAIVVIAISFLSVILVRGYFWWLHPLNQSPDQTLYLDTAVWLMEGKVPYRDFFDWNPPLIMYLSIIPLMVSHSLHLHPITSLNLLVIFSTFLSAATSLYLAYRYLERDQFFVFVPMCAGAIFFMLEQQFDMAEREQLFMIAYLPFMVLRYAVWTRPGIKIYRPLALFVGLVAGVGLALKPQFVFAAAAFEFVLLVRNDRFKRRLIRPEIFSVLLVMVVYACYLLFFLPKEAWSVLQNEVMPLFVHGYEYSSKGLMFMLHGGPYFYLPMTIMCYAMGVAFFANRFSQWAAPLAAFTLVGFFNYLHGDQAWIYRLIPMVTGSYLLCGLGISLICKYWYERSRAPKAVATFLVSSCLLTASIYSVWDLNFTIEDLKRCSHFHNLRDIGNYVGWTPCSPMPDFGPIFLAMMKYTKVGDKVLYVGTGINDGYPAMVQSGRRCATRYPFCPLIVIDHCIINRPEEERSKWVQLMYKQINEYKLDILRDQPDLIMILDYPPFIDMLQRYGFFDRCMGGYRKYGKEHDVLIYLPAWNLPKDLEPEKTPPSRPGDASPEDPSIAYPELPAVPPVTKADMQPPDEVVIPPPTPPKKRETGKKGEQEKEHGNKEEENLLKLELQKLFRPKPESKAEPEDDKKDRTSEKQPKVNADAAQNYYSARPSTVEELERALPPLPKPDASQQRKPN